MKFFAQVGLLIIVSPLAVVPNHHSSLFQKALSKPPSGQAQSVDEFLKRWKDEKLRSFLDGAMWTLIHDYTEYAPMEKVLKTLQTYFEALEKYEKGDHSLLDQIGGIKAFKDKMAGWLKVGDKAIRAFAATALGISGDLTYAPDIARLLNRTVYKKNDYLRYDKVRAAIALGLLGAKDQAKAVVGLLDDEEEDVRDAAKQSLEMMGATDLIRDMKRKKVRND